MNKINAEEKMEKLRSRVQAQKKEIPNEMLVCPFQSSPEEEVACNNRCALYRGGKQKGFNCPITELSSMSWIMKGRPMKKMVNQQNKY